MQRDWWWYCSDWTCERFSFWPHQEFQPWDLWISSPALYHCTTVTSDFHLWQFQVFNSGAEGLVVVLFWLDLWEIFFLATLGFEPRTSGSLVLHFYHCTTVTSDFHLWQFQVFNSGAEGLVVVLFWLDLWEIFFLATPGFEPQTTGSLVLHSTTAPQQLLIFTSDNFSYWTMVHRIGGGIVLIGPVRDILFGHTRVSTWDLWISSPALYPSATVTSDFHLWQFQVFNSGAEGLVVVLFWLDLWEIFFLATMGFEPRTSGSLVLHSTTAPQQTSDFHLWQFQVFNSGAEGLVVVLFWLDLWEIFFFATPGFDPVTSGSLVLHSTTAATAASDFHLWQFQVFNSGAEGLVVVLFWLDLWEIFF